MLVLQSHSLKKIAELITAQTSAAYGIFTDKTYFDYTNFFFEIDREDGFRMRGHNRENRKEPIVRLGLLLDSNLVPVGMKMYPEMNQKSLSCVK